MLSSIPPKNDFPIIEKQLILETVNANLMEICTKKACLFVNNDNNFRTADNSITPSF